MIPDSIFTLTNLIELGLSNNQITTMQKCIQQLTQLQILCFAKNNLKSVLPTITFLTKLQKLDLSRNILTKISNNYLHLIMLKLNHNQFK